MNTRRRLMALAAAIPCVIAARGLVRARRLTRYQPIVRGIAAGTLTAPASGILRLSGNFAGVTPRDEIYVETRADGRLLILFPRRYGRGADLEGYLYCRGGLRPADSYVVDWGASGVHTHIAVAGRDLLTATPYAPNWYAISRRVD
jgi:hypothetical protein